MEKNKQQSDTVFTAFLDTTLAPQMEKEDIVDCFKISLLKLPRLVLSDTQAIDNQVFRELIKNESFLKIINPKSSSEQAIMICTRVGQTFQDTVESWVDVKFHNPHGPKTLSGVSQQTNMLIKAAHKNRTLSFSYLKEIDPEYYEHVISLNDNISERNTFEKSLSKNSLEQAVRKTIADVSSIVTDIDKKNICTNLEKILNEQEILERSEIRDSFRKFIQEKDLNQESRNFIEESILNFSYQRSYAEIADENLVAGVESGNWVMKKENIRIESTFKIQAEVPSNPFLVDLDWDGIRIIREDDNFLKSIESLRSDLTGSETTKKELITNYIFSLRKAYKKAADAGHARDPFHLRNVSINWIQTLAPGLGSFFGNMFEGIGIPFAKIIGDVTGELTSIYSQGFIFQNDIFVPREFRQFVGSLAGY